MQKVKNWFSGLSAGGKVGAVIGMIVASFVTIGVAGAAVSPTKPPQPAPTPPTASQTTQSGPTKEVKTETQTKAVAFQVVKKDDATKTKGTETTVQNGTNGVETIVYRVTYTDGKETKREVQSDTVTTPAVDQVVAVGTYVAPAPTTTSTQSSTATTSTGQRTGAVCVDGSHSTATGSGACSHHGGVSYWLYN